AEYAGGYTDMLAQRGEDIARETTGKPAKPREPKAAQGPAAAEPRAGKRRLSFNEKYALEALPGEIAALQEKIRAAQEELADASLYARDRKAFDEISAGLVAAQDALAAAEDKWLELEILRETIDGGGASLRLCEGGPTGHPHGRDNPPARGAPRKNPSQQNMSTAYARAR